MEGRLKTHDDRDILSTGLRTNRFSSENEGSHLVGAHVGARDLVGDAVDLGFGESLLEELKLGAAGEAVPDRDPEGCTYPIPLVTRPPNVPR